MGMLVHAHEQRVCLDWRVPPSVLKDATRGLDSMQELLHLRPLPPGNLRHEKVGGVDWHCPLVRGLEVLFRRVCL